jgi:hypothetical protein
MVTDTMGKKYQSVHKTITLAANDSPSITLQLEKNLIFKGETVDITAVASDDNTVSLIELFANGQLLGSCSNTGTCTIHTGPWTQGPLVFTARATDSLGTNAITDPVTITVQ